MEPNTCPVILSWCLVAQAKPAYSVVGAHAAMKGQHYVVEIKFDGERLLVSLCVDTHNHLPASLCCCSWPPRKRVRPALDRPRRLRASGRRAQMQWTANRRPEPFACRRMRACLCPARLGAQLHKRRQANASLEGLPSHDIRYTSRK